MPLWHVQYTNFFFYHFASSQVIPQFPKQNFDWVSFFVLIIPFSYMWLSQHYHVEKRYKFRRSQLHIFLHSAINCLRPKQLSHLCLLMYVLLDSFFSELRKLILVAGVCLWSLWCGSIQYPAWAVSWALKSPRNIPLFSQQRSKERSTWGSNTMESCKWLPL